MTAEFWNVFYVKCWFEGPPLAVIVLWNTFSQFCPKYAAPGVTIWIAPRVKTNFQSVQKLPGDSIKYFPFISSAQSHFMCFHFDWWNIKQASVQVQYNVRPQAWLKGKVGKIERLSSLTIRISKLKCILPWKKNLVATLEWNPPKCDILNSKCTFYIVL